MEIPWCLDWGNCLYLSFFARHCKDIIAFVPTRTLKDKYEEISAFLSKGHKVFVSFLSRCKSLCKYLICVRQALWLSPQYMSANHTFLGALL